MVISGAELNSRPVTEPAEILEAAPGLAIVQHSGSGKANQYYVRGYNLDHGTDFATFGDDVPINSADQCSRAGLHRPQLAHPGNRQRGGRPQGSLFR